MLLLYLVILGGCLVCEEVTVEPRRVNSDRTCSQAGLLLVAGSPQGPLKPACSWLSLFLSVLRDFLARLSLPFPREQRGTSMREAGLGLEWSKHRVVNGL